MTAQPYLPASKLFNQTKSKSHHDSKTRFPTYLNWYIFRAAYTGLLELGGLFLASLSHRPAERFLVPSWTEHLSWYWQSFDRNSRAPPFRLQLALFSAFQYAKSGRLPCVFFSLTLAARSFPGCVIIWMHLACGCMHIEPTNLRC